MMSLEKFAERCGNLIKQRTPFIAYRHDRGCGVLILNGGCDTEYTIKYKCLDRYGKDEVVTEKVIGEKRAAELLTRRMGARVIRSKVIHKTPLAATVAGFRRAIVKMQKDPRTNWSLTTIECDGNGYSIEGVRLAELIEAMGV